MIPAPAPLIYLDRMPDQQTIIDWLREIRLKAYVPGSSYKVASLLLMRHGDGFYFAAGVNVESEEHRLSLHGEESAIAALVTAFGKKAVIDAAWVMAAPDYLTGASDNKMADIKGQTCGNCRQQIAGLASSPSITVQAISLNGEAMSDSLDRLLPYSFSFADFDPSIHSRRDQDRQRHTDFSTDPLLRLLRREKLSENEAFEWLASLEAIDYASGKNQAAVLILDNGCAVAGVRVENAAYTGLSAIQSAIGIAVTALGPVRISAAYLYGAKPGGGAMHILSELAVTGGIPVTLFSPDGKGQTVTLPAREE